MNDQDVQTSARETFCGRQTETARAAENQGPVVAVESSGQVRRLPIRGAGRYPVGGSRGLLRGFDAGGIRDATQAPSGRDRRFEIPRYRRVGSSLE